jgi:RimJ/RimL family protein N-acetyltransferase
MPEIIEFSTPRLRLRQWTDEDREPFAAMNADPDVMKYFAGVETREGSDRLSISGAESLTSEAGATGL